MLKCVQPFDINIRPTALQELALCVGNNIDKFVPLGSSFWESSHAFRTLRYEWLCKLPTEYIPQYQLVFKTIVNFALHNDIEYANLVAALIMRSNDVSIKPDMYLPTPPSFFSVDDICTLGQLLNENSSTSAWKIISLMCIYILQNDTVVDTVRLRDALHSLEDTEGILSRIFYHNELKQMYAVHFYDTIRSRLNYQIEHIPNNTLTSVNLIRLDSRYRNYLTFLQPID